MATGPVLCTLLFAPFLHIHVKAEDSHTRHSSEGRVAVVHVHFPEEQGASASENGRSSDLDHSGNAPQPFVLVALLTLRPLALSLEIDGGVAILPVFHCPLIVPLERVNLTALPAIHDPPGPLQTSPRAPPSRDLF